MSDRGRRLREALAEVEALRGVTIEQARRVVAAHGVAQQCACIEALRRLLVDLDRAQATERTVIESFNATPFGLCVLGLLGDVEVTEQDSRELAPVLGRVPDLAEQLVGIEALDRVVPR